MPKYHEHYSSGRAPSDRGGLPLFLGLACRGAKPSIPKQLARPGDLAPLGGHTIVCASPYVVMGWNGTSQDTLHPHLSAAAHKPSRVMTPSEEA
jgi:hypothetical protein